MGNLEFHEQPVDLGPLPGFDGARNWGDDGGYRDVTCEENGDPMVALSDDIKVRDQYAGVELVDGSYNPRLVLPGGTGSSMYGRRGHVETLRAGNRLLAERYPGMEMMVVDTFRSGVRQASGSSRLAIGKLGGNMNPDLATLYKAGIDGDKVFSLVRADREHPDAQEFLQDMSLHGDIAMICEIHRESMETVLFNLLDIAANMRAARPHLSGVPNLPLNVDVPLNFQNNAHAGGGASDLFLFENGNIANGQIPYDFSGIQGAMDYMEYPENFDAYNAFLRSGTPDAEYLKTHLQKLGIDGDVTSEQWIKWRDAQRIIFHTMKAVGATFFSDTAKSGDDFWGAENWHFEGHQESDVRNGNPGHALQMKGTAVWSGRGAHQQLRAMGVLED